MKIFDLKAYLVYDIINNPHPNHIYYSIDESGMLYIYDSIIGCFYESTDSYNKILKMGFVSTNFKMVFKNRRWMREVI